MRKFTGARNYEDREEQMKALGWHGYELGFHERMSKDFGNIYVDVCIRINGRFIAYNHKTNEPLGDHLSEKLEGTDWYDEVLEIIYE